MEGLSENYWENVSRMDAALRVEQNFDLIKKTLYLGQEQITMYYIDGFVASASVNKLMIYFLSLRSLGEPKEKGGEAAARYFSEHHLPYVEADVTDNVDTMVGMVLSGTALILG